MDLILRNAALPYGRTGQDIGIEGGRITAVQPALSAKGREEIDAAGRLVSPPFVDAHFHMDATLSYGLPRVNRSGTLLEGIALWGELKPQLTFEAIVERALAYCDWAVAKGLLAIRSHVDVCDPRLLAVEALLEVRCEPLTLPCRPRRCVSPASVSMCRDIGSSVSSQCMSTRNQRCAASSHSSLTLCAPSAMVRSKCGMPPTTSTPRSSARFRLSSAPGERSTPS